MQQLPVKAEYEPDFGGFTAWYDSTGSGWGCLMRILGGPRVFETEAAALRAARAHTRKRSK